MTEKFSLIPNDVDFLLTHDAPYGTSDVVLEDVPWNKHEHIGNVPLRDAIIEKWITREIYHEIRIVYLRISEREPGTGLC